jgi:hypothetical protein
MKQLDKLAQELEMMIRESGCNLPEALGTLELVKASILHEAFDEESSEEDTTVSNDSSSNG